MTKSAEKWIEMRLTEEHKDAKDYFEAALLKRTVSEGEYWRGTMNAFEKALAIFREGLK